MSRPFTLYVIHHAHTDVGYTEAPHLVERWHADFMRQALDVLERRPAFRWVSETFWAVERFWDRADVGDRERFVTALRAGRIGLSASYLNFSELLDGTLLRAVTARAGRFGRAVGVPVRSAMSADVNGFGWGFADALLDAGVENFFACVHAHHGTVPLGRAQVPFWWETSTGRRLLVWSGEHYHYGNELGLVPRASSSYLIKDECDEATIYGDHRRVAETRIPRYVRTLREGGFPFDFAPVMASGLRDDNAPPNPAILDAADAWNESHGAAIRVEMATLDDFFTRLRAEEAEIPVHRGDWPDWWSDGPASQPAAVAFFRQAQRDLAGFRALARRYPDLGLELDDAEAVEGELALFAEHTFSHAEAMSAPWHPLVHAIEATKAARVARAAASIGDARAAAHERLGGSALAPDLPLGWRVINPGGTSVADVARLEVGHYEFHERGLDRGFEVRDAETGGGLPAEAVAAPRGAEVLVPLELAAGGERRLEVVPADNGRTWEEERPASTGLETDFVAVSWSAPAGVVHVVDKGTGRDLVRSDARHSAFQPVYDATPVMDPSDICAVRSRMGLNRKGSDARIEPGACGGEAFLRSGEVFETARLVWEVDGTRYCEMDLSAHRHTPRLDVALRLHKESLWAPENLYLSLPFTAGAGAVTRIDKAGTILRPRRDQIPGTLTDFYAVESGFLSSTEEYGVLVLMPDQHLLQLGPLEPGERPLAGDPRLADDPALPYAWLMTNYWETNFAADLGGFYAFRFSLIWGEALGDPKLSFARGRAALRGLETIRLKGERS